MMRYQRVSPDCLGLPNGRKTSSIRTTSSSCKDDDADDIAGRISNYAPFDDKPLRVRSGSASGSTNPSSSATQAQENQNSNSHHFPSGSDSLPPPENIKSHEINGRCSGGAGGDVLLHWGHNKRSRGSRVENRTVGDESSMHSRQHVKIQRRAAIAGAERIAAAAAASAMPPPCGGGYTRGANLRASMPLRDSTVTHHNRTVEDRSSGHCRSEKRSPPSPPEKANHHHHKTGAAAAVTNRFGMDPSSSSMNDHQHQESSKHASDQDTVGSGSGGGVATAAAAAPEKVSLEQFEWPRIYISLSRKEKEDDFLAMKGTKLPQRPKKRAKNIDKSIQYCFPGMWLSDLTRGRYEVREKKCVKKKRRGLKGMESMDSDSE